jgi:hypothetical protein
VAVFNVHPHTKMEGKTFPEFTNCRLYVIMHKLVPLVTVKNSPVEFGLVIRRE